MMKPDNPIGDQKKLRGMKIGVVGKPMASNLHSAGAAMLVASRDASSV